MDEKRLRILEKSIKVFEGAIITALGILFICLYNSKGLNTAISYCVGTVFIIFGLFSICLSFMLKKGVLSFDVISGSLVTALGIMLYINSSLLTYTLPKILSLTLLVLSLTLIVEDIICYKTKDIKRGIIYSVIIAIMLAFGITILVLDCQDKANGNSGMQFINVLVGITFIILGIGYIVITLFSDRNKKDVIDNKPVKKEKKVRAKKVKSQDVKEDKKVEEIKALPDTNKEENKDQPTLFDKDVIDAEVADEKDKK